MTEEWHPGGSPSRSEAISSYKDYLSDITDHDEEGGENQHEEMDVLESQEGIKEEDVDPREQQHRLAAAAASRKPPPTSSPQNRKSNTPQTKRQEDKEEEIRTVLSPFSPEFRRQRKADLRVDTSVPHPLSSPTIENCTLSLGNERKVTVMVHVRNPPPVEMERKSGRLPCVLPLETFNSANIGRSKMLSPTAIAMSSALETQNLMVVNPEAFGKNISNQVTMEVLKKIVGRHVSSEDWVRLFSFSQVLWPEGALLGFFRMAQAISRDLTAPASIANRTVLAHGHADKKFTLFGTCINDNVTKAFASKDPASSSETDRLRQITDIMERFGMVGLTVFDLLKIKEMQPEITLGLTMLEITGDDKFVDLNKKWSDHRSSNGGDSSDAPRLLYSGDTKGGVMQGLDIREVDSLKSLGQFFRRCFKIANKRSVERGQIIASIYIYRSVDEIGETAKVPVAHFVDLANPIALDLTKETTELGRALTSRNASVRKTMSTLGQLLRNCLLKEAGNHVTLPFRESLLTKVLQKSIEKTDGKVILMTSVSAMVDQYHNTMHSLLYSNSLLEKQGEPPKSPFDALSRAATNATSPTSHTSLDSEHISLSELDPSYEKDLLPMVTGDARQRLTKAGFQPTPTLQNDVYLSSDLEEISETGGQHQQYLELDPGDFENQHNASSTRNRNVTAASPRKEFHSSLLPTPQAGNSSKHSRQKRHISTGRVDDEQTPDGPRANDSSFALDTMEYGKLSSHLNNVSSRPSPLPTDTGVGTSERHRKTKQYEPRQTNSFERQMDDLSAELRQKTSLGQSGSLTDNQAMDELSFEVKERARHTKLPDYLGSPQSTDQMLFSLGVVDKSPRNSPQRPNRSTPPPPPRTAEKRGQRRTPPSPPQSDRLPPRNKSRVHNLENRSPAPRLNVYGDSSDNDTDSQIGDIDDQYMRLSQNQHANAQSVSKHLRQLRESEMEVVQRISAERDSYQAELSRVSNERQRELERHAEEERKLRRELAGREDEKRALSSELEQVKSTVAEFNEIAEEAVVGRENVERQLAELKKKLRQMEAETVPKEAFEAVVAENQTMSRALLDEKEKVSSLESEVENHTERILGLESTLQTRDAEIERRNDIQANDAQRISELESELMHSKSEISSLKLEVEHLATEATDARRNLQVREQELGEDINNLERELDVSRAELNESVEMHEKLQVENERLLREIQDKEEVLEAERKERETKIEKLQDSIEALKNDLEARAADVTDLVDVNQELETAKSEVEASLDAEREAKEKLQGMNDRLEECMEKAPNELLTVLEEWSAEQQQRNQRLTSENDSLRNEIYDLRQNDEALRARIERMRHHERRHSREYGDQVHQICQRCSQLAAATETQAALMSWDKDRLENLALDLSLIIRELDGRINLNDLGGLRDEVQAMERVVNALSQMVRHRTEEIRSRSLWED